MFETILGINAIWFGMGFHTFAIRKKIFVKTLVLKEHRASPVYDILVETGSFLGGFNFALCLLNVLIFAYLSVFPNPSQRVILCIVFAVAHGSQFLPNVFIAMDNLKGKGVWQVKGKMLFIFVTDFVLMVANFVIAIIYVQ